MRTLATKPLLRVNNAFISSDHTVIRAAMINKSDHRHIFQGSEDMTYTEIQNRINRNIMRPKSQTLKPLLNHRP
jgi:hypothetical protein